MSKWSDWEYGLLREAVVTGGLSSSFAAQCIDLLNQKQKEDSNEWIHIAHKSPEFGQKCLVAGNGKILGFSQWGSQGIKISGWVFPDAPMYSMWIGENITHWMPLPPPPEGK